MTQRPEHTAVSGQLQPSSTSPALTLALFAGVCAALVTTVHLFTSDPIAIAKSAYSLKQVRAVLEAGASPALHELANQDWRESDRIDSSRTIYGAGSGHFAISGFSSDGYSGRIEIVTGIDLSAPNGTARVIAVRVTAHRETPGIGDRITSKKWLGQFQESWQKTGPQRVDALSGATISATAVTDAVTRTVAFAELNAPELLQQNLISETAR